MKNAIDSELDEITKNQLSREEDTLKPVGIKQFDDLRFLFPKSWEQFKNNPEIDNIIIDIEGYVDTHKNYFDKEELSEIIKKYLPFFKKDMPTVKDILKNKHKNSVAYILARIYRIMQGNKIKSQDIGMKNYENAAMRAFIKLYQNSKETNGSLIYTLDSKNGEREEKKVRSKLKNPELTYIYNMLMLEMMK